MPTPESKSAIPPGVPDPARRTIASKLLKDKMTWTKYSYETEGKYTEIDVVISPGYDNPAHYHTLFKETFTCTTGVLSVILNGKKMQLKPGETAVVEIGDVHSLANDSEGDATFLTRLEPGHQGFEQSMYIVHGLAEDGLTNSDGIPSSPIHLAVIAPLMDTWLQGWLFRMAGPLLFLLSRYGKGSGAEAQLLQKYWHND